MKVKKDTYWVTTHLGVSKARMTVERSRPSLEVVTCATYWGGPRPEASTTLEKAGLPEQSHREPGRWQQSPVVMATRNTSSSGPKAHGPRSLGRGQQEDEGQGSHSLGFESSFLSLACPICKLGLCIRTTKIQ